MERQIQILKCFEDTETVLSKYEIKHKSGICYYYNTDKHLGDILSRMVNNGSLERVRKGFYRSTGSRNKTNKFFYDKYQAKLF